MCFFFCQTLTNVRKTQLSVTRFAITRMEVTLAAVTWDTDLARMRTLAQVSKCFEEFIQPFPFYLKFWTIVIIRNWFGNQANFKGTNKDKNIYVGRSTTLHNLLFRAYTLWLNDVTVTFLLVSSSGTNYDLLCLCRPGHGQKSEQKRRTKNFAKLPNHLPLLTMFGQNKIKAIE